MLYMLQYSSWQQHHGVSRSSRRTALCLVDTVWMHIKLCSRLLCRLFHLSVEGEHRSIQKLQHLVCPYVLSSLRRCGVSIPADYCVCPACSLSQVRETTGAQQKQSPYYEELVKAQEAAQNAGLGLWNKVRGCADVCRRVGNPGAASAGS
jgi:hypothetical protein